MATLERIYTIPLAEAYEYVRTKRAKRAVKLVRQFAIRHMKAEDAKISEGVNQRIFRDGIQKPPRRIKVRIVKGEDGIAKVWMIGEEEKLKAEAEKKSKELEAKKAASNKKEEAKISDKDAPAKENKATPEEAKPSKEVSKEQSPKKEPAPSGK
ncbi:MAG: 50S ribosomal protein L31e [Candidatus Anstonellaceae archaeon]